MTEPTHCAQCGESLVSGGVTRILWSNCRAYCSDDCVDDMLMLRHFGDALAQMSNRV